MGTHNVKITANNGTQTTDQEFTITVKALPTMSNFANLSKYVGDVPFTLTAPTSNSAGTFTYTSSNASVATISGSNVTITGPGTTTITATQAANGLYTEGTITATLTVGINPPGNALTFDGSGDFVQIGTASTFDARNMKTVEAWVKFNDLISDQEIISKSTSSNGLELIIYGGKLAIFAMGGGVDNHVDYPTSNLVANRWYHIAATHNGVNTPLRLYVNGVLVGSATTPSGMVNSSNPLHLGKWNENGNISTAGRYFKGTLDEVRIWNVERTQLQLTAGMYQEIDPATAGLQAYYRFSEGTANGNNTAVTTTLDATANANNGTLNGFAKTGTASNYTESYALVAPVLEDAADITGVGFTAKWQTPTTGTVNSYLLDVSESATFATFVTGYQNKDVGNVNEFEVTGLTANKTYYFRVRANKTSVNTQGTYSNVKTAATTKSDQTITFAMLPSKTYGDDDFTLTATASSGLTVTFESDDTAVATVSGTTVTIIKSGTVNIIAKQAGNTLYNAAPQVSRVLVIDKATLTVTANNASKTYDKVAYSGGNGISYAGFITGDNAANSVTGTVSYGGNAQGAVNANTYAITPSGLNSANYAIAYKDGTLTINKAGLTVTAQNASKTYNGLAYTGGNGISYSGFVSGDNAANSVTGTVAFGGTSQGAINVASNYTIIPSGLSSTNYNISYANGTLVVNRAPLTAIADNKARCFGLANPAFTVSYTGFVNNETASVLTTAPTVTTNANVNSAAGNYVLTVAGGAAANYTISYQTGQLTVYALPVIDIATGKLTISRGDQVQLVASGGTGYSWANANGIVGGQGSATLTIRPSETTTYTVTVTNANGCTDSKSITIEVLGDYKLAGTNLLTPNGDGYNDVFKIENIDLYPNNTVKIYDRGGRLVYSKVRYDNTWDGTFNGTPLAEGTYYYMIDFGKGASVIKGFITIVRNGR
jgi:gliding motility-associated-like protein